MDERTWIDANAHPLTAVTPDEPLADLEPLAAMVGGAEVVGLGESTRAGREVLLLAHRVVRFLVQRKGFRTLALQDDSSVVAALDDHVRTGAGDLRTLIAEMWRPWQNVEFLAVLEWLRSFNAQHPDDMVGLVGLAPPGARSAHYDDVIEHVRRVAPDRLGALLAHYDPIRTAHLIGEHVQRAKGIHPGRPFVEHADDALQLVRALPAGGDRRRVVELAELIAQFHANSIAAGHDFDAAAEAAADALLAEHRTSGRKIVYWEGFAHTANARSGGLNAMGVRLQSVGARLRRHLGARYHSMVIGFGSGSISGGVAVPEPPADFADAVLNSAAAERYLLDVRAPRDAAVGDWLRGPHKLRVIAGIYDPAHDAEHFVAAGALDEWFDVVLRVRWITPATLI